MRISEWHQKHRDEIPRHKTGRNKGVRRLWLQERREAAERRQEEARQRGIEFEIQHQTGEGT